MVWKYNTLGLFFCKGTRMTDPCKGKNKWVNTSYSVRKTFKRTCSVVCWKKYFLPHFIDVTHRHFKLCFLDDFVSKLISFSHCLRIWLGISYSCGQWYFFRDDFQPFKKHANVLLSTNTDIVVDVPFSCVLWLYRRVQEARVALIAAFNTSSLFGLVCFSWQHPIVSQSGTVIPRLSKWVLVLLAVWSKSCWKINSASLLTRADTQLRTMWNKQCKKVTGRWLLWFLTK